jgi:hypothetical protein
MAEHNEGPAFYATGKRGVWRDVRAVLHPPYTAWHLSYVVLGAMVAPRVNWSTLFSTLIAFFLAVGVSAHALDELRGRPLSTDFPSWVLTSAAAVSLVGAVALGAVGISRVGWGLLAFIVVGAALVLAYNLELFGGRVHTDLGLALSWGAFPVLTSAYAQTKSLPLSAVFLAVAATLFTAAQRSLSTPVRKVRRKVRAIDGTMTMTDGSVEVINRATLLRPNEYALRAMSWGMMALAVAFVFARRVH